MSLVAIIDGRHLKNIAVATIKYWECWCWSFSQNCHDKGGGKGLASFLEVPLWNPNLLSGRIHKTCPGGVCAAFRDWWDMNNDQQSVLLWNCKSPQSNKIGCSPLNSSCTTATENQQQTNWQVFYCHCTTCRAQTGALAVLFGAFPRSSVIETFGCNIKKFQQKYC